MNILLFLTNFINMVSKFAIEIYNGIKYLFEDPVMKAEYMGLLEIGAWIGYVLAVLFILLLQLNQIKRIKQMKKKTVINFKIILFSLTGMTLSLVFISSKIEFIALAFISYILISVFIDRVRDYLFVQTKLKTAHPKQII